MLWGRALVGHLATIAFLFLAQALCAILFVSDIFSSVVGFSSVPMSWEMRELLELPVAELLDQRYGKFRRMGVFDEGAQPETAQAPSA